MDPAHAWQTTKPGPFPEAILATFEGPRPKQRARDSWHGKPEFQTIHGFDLGAMPHATPSSLGSPRLVQVHWWTLSTPHANTLAMSSLDQHEGLHFFINHTDQKELWIVGATYHIIRWSIWWVNLFNLILESRTVFLGSFPTYYLLLEIIICNR